MSNKLVMSLINKFLVENEEDIMEFITKEDEVIRVIHKDTLDKIKRVHLRSIRRDKKNKRIEEETKRQANEVRKPLSLATLLRGEIV